MIRTNLLRIIKTGFQNFWHNSWLSAATISIIVLTLFVMTSTYDIIVGAVTIIFFITAGPRVFRAFLPPVELNAFEEILARKGRAKTGF